MALTVKQQRFVDGVISGLSLSDAYRAAYDTRGMSLASVNREAARLKEHPKIAPLLAQAREHDAKTALWSRERAQERLLAVNSAAMAEIKKNGFKAPSAIHGFIDSARELNKLVDAAEASASDSHNPLDVLDLIAANFYPLFCEVMSRCGKGEWWLAGGRGSTKSSFISLCIVELVRRYPFVNALVIRRQSNTLRDSVMAQIQWAVDALGLGDEFTSTVSPMEITRKATGQKVRFVGMDKPDKVKGTKFAKGYCAIVWFEELDQIAGWAQVRSVRQSLMRGGSRFWWFYSYNPPRSKSSWVNEQREVMQELPSVTVSDSTYLDVIASGHADWLGDEFIADAEHLKAEDEQAYRHEYMGEPVGMGAEVFDRVEFREVTDDEIAAFDNPKIGQDFGWYPDPWAFTVSEWQQSGRTLITYAEGGGCKMQPNEQADMLGAVLRRYGLEGQPVCSDDASPKDIDALYSLGINARRAGKGNLRDASYKYLQSARWVIDPKRCPKLAAEVRAMEYETTPDGEVVNRIPDGNDHFIDATRYAVMRDVRHGRTAYLGAKRR